MSRQTPSLSFEVFPPNPAVGNDKIISALQDMRELTPHFISVTASNNKFNIKETTVRLADFIQNDLAIPTIAHLPAIYLTKHKVAETIADLDKVSQTNRRFLDIKFIIAGSHTDKVRCQLPHILQG